MLKYNIVKLIKKRYKNVPIDTHSMDKILQKTLSFILSKNKTKNYTGNCLINVLKIYNPI